MRLHLIGNLIFVGVLIPTLVWSASKYGGVGAGYVWLGLNLVTYFAWVPFVHSKFIYGLNTKWYFEDTLIIFLACGISGYLMNFLIYEDDTRIWKFIEIIVKGLIILISGVLASSAARLQAKNIANLFLKRFRII